SLTRDRAGYRAEAPLLPGGAASLASEGIAPGTVQLPPDGRLIFLLAERPTTGGYRKAGFVAAVDLRLVAQSPARGRLKLARIAASEARGLLREEEAWVQGLCGRKSRSVPA
ncbi:MAG: KipI antagonist, partial [Anaerolineales bacterium]